MQHESGTGLRERRAAVHVCFEAPLVMGLIALVLAGTGCARTNSPAVQAPASVTPTTVVAETAKPPLKPADVIGTWKGRFWSGVADDLSSGNTSVSNDLATYMYVFADGLSATEDKDPSHSAVYGLFFDDTPWSIDGSSFKVTLNYDMGVIEYGLVQGRLQTVDRSLVWERIAESPAEGVADWLQGDWLHGNTKITFSKGVVKLNEGGKASKGTYKLERNKVIAEFTSGGYQGILTYKLTSRTTLFAWVPEDDAYGTRFERMD